MTLTELKAAVQAKLICDEAAFLSALDQIIRDAELHIHRNVMLPDSKKFQAVTTAIETQDVTVPSDYLAALRVWISFVLDGKSYQRPPMLPKSASFIREVAPNSAFDEPKFYAWADNSRWLLWPTPDRAYTVNIEYVSTKPLSIVDGNTWLSVNQEDALTKAVIYEAAVWLKNNAMAQAYKVERDAALAPLAAVLGAPPRDEMRA